MSTKDKLDVLDLVINTLKEYEKAQNDILERMEMLEDKFNKLLNRHLEGRQVLYDGDELNIKAIKDSLEPLKRILNGLKSKGTWIPADEYSQPTYLDGLNEVIEIIEVHLNDAKENLSSRQS